MDEVEGGEAAAVSGWGGAPAAPRRAARGGCRCRHRPRKAVLTRAAHLRPWPVERAGRWQALSSCVRERSPRGRRVAELAEPSARCAIGAMDVINPADEGGAAPPSTSTDVDATKAKTQRALLGGLRSGALEAAVAKMEEDTAAEDEAVSALSARLPVVTSAGQLRESRRVAAEETMAAPQAALTSKGSFGSRKAPKLKPVTSREATPAATEVITADTVLTAALMFRALDADASGGLDMTELKRLVDRLGVPTSEDQLRRMLESKLQRDLGAGEKPELDFEGFEAFIDPILDEIREADRNAAEEETRELAAPDGLPAGSFEASALGFLTLENPARRVAIKLVSKQAFDYVVLILIGINSVLMALEDPLRPPEDDPEWMARAELTFVRPIAPLP